MTSNTTETINAPTPNASRRRMPAILMRSRYGTASLAVPAIQAFTRPADK
jgi:hypothetical protein